MSLRLCARSRCSFWHAPQHRPLTLPAFKLDVMPVFMRHGCNAGDCHGAARGKDGFMLSLFGYDPEGDHYRLLEEHPGRRINVAAPKESLLLQKATGNVTHTGGELFADDDESYKIIHDWIAAGAPRDPESTPEVKGIRMEPPAIEFASPKRSRQTKIIAEYTDGSQRDVTRWCRFLSSNDGVASINNSGSVTGNRPGGAHVFARFSRFTQGSAVIILPEGDFDWSNPKPINYIDELVFAKLEKLRIEPSPLASDEHFLRRVTIDLTGMLPTPDEYDAFMTSTDPDKRARKIDELIAREDFAELWTAKWGEWLRIKGDTNPAAGRSMKAAWSFFYWLRDQFIEDRPLDELFHELITGTGSNHPSIRPATSTRWSHRAAASTPDRSAKTSLRSRSAFERAAQSAITILSIAGRWTTTTVGRRFSPAFKRKRGREGREMLISVNVDAEPAAHLIDGRPDAASVPWRRRPRRYRSRSLVKCWQSWLTSKDNRTVPPQHGQSHLASLLWTRHRRTNRRHPHQQPAKQRAATRRTWATFSRGPQLQSPQAGSRHLQLAHVSAFGVNERIEQG